MLACETNKEEPGILEVPNVKQEPPDQLLDESSASKVPDLKYETTDQLEEPNVPDVPSVKYEATDQLEEPTTPEVPNVKYEPVDLSQDPLKLRIKKALGIVIKPVTESLEDFVGINGCVSQIMLNGSVTRTPSDLAPEITAAGRSSGVRNPSVPTHDDHLQEPRNCPPPAKLRKRRSKPANEKIDLKCDICSILFFSVESLEKHMVDAHVADKEFDSTKCGKSSISQEKLNSHMSEHEAGKEKQSCYKCPICSKIFSVRFSLKRHMAAHQAGKPFKCKLCPKSYVRDWDLEVHEMNQHGKLKKLKCPHCPKSYTRPYAFREHLRTHSEDKAIIVSENCSESFTPRDTLQEPKPQSKGSSSSPGSQQPLELGKNDKLEFHKCQMCPKTFTTKRNFRQHQLFHLADADKPFKCKICPKSFVKAWILEEHEMNRHGKPKRFNCPKCPKSFSRKFVLQNHVRIHSDEITVVCENCSESFKSRKLFQKHKRKCKVSCYDQGLQPLELGKNDKLKGHKCQMCSKTFSTKRNCQQHQLFHLTDADKPFKCQSCPKSFVKAWILNEHEMNRHGKPKKFNCFKCHKSFSRKFDMRVHLRKHSNDEKLVSEKCNEEIANNRTEFNEGKEIKVSEKNEDESRKACHKCPVCSRKFDSHRRYNLKRHMLTHGHDTSKPALETTMDGNCQEQ